MGPMFKIGEIVRRNEILHEEGTVTEVADNKFFVTFNNTPQANGWYTDDQIVMVRGAVAPGQNPVVNLSSIGQGAIGVSPLKTK